MAAKQGEKHFIPTKKRLCLAHEGWALWNHSLRGGGMHVLPPDERNPSLSHRRWCFPSKDGSADLSRSAGRAQDLSGHKLSSSPHRLNWHCKTTVSFPPPEKLFLATVTQATSNSETGKVKGFLCILLLFNYIPEVSGMIYWTYTLIHSCFWFVYQRDTRGPLSSKDTHFFYCQSLAVSS